jgi:hypothetical protein
VLTPVPVPVLDGPIASRRRRNARSARGESKGSMPNTPVFLANRTEPRPAEGGVAIDQPLGRSPAASSFVRSGEASALSWLMVRR